ncbi:hypothetical protein PLICBS_008857 [Purpureocillium lilacinum]|uniref:uncharacterized protein n=1 Tax=Purpureocillium lilacinum TaxID=33203 RepID=UPI00207DE4E7|nr:hypothetical protein PLICBS_008857 [Purpureocillium lilacinum]
MEKVRKAIVIGGGPAGLSTALRLHQTTDISCTVYELRPEPTTLGGAIGIFSNGMRLFHRLGLHDELLSRGSSHSRFVLHSLQGSILGEQDMVGAARETMGFGYLRIKRTDLLDVLLRATTKARIPIHYGKRLTAIQDSSSGVTVTFSDGTTDSADILLGCDGIHSSVRKLYVDPAQEPVYSGFAGYGSIIPITALGSSAAATASQVRGIDATLTQEGAFAAMSCSAADDELYWAFSGQVSVPEAGDTRDGWEVRRKEEVDGFKASMLQVLGGASGDWATLMRRVVEATDVVKFYPVFKLPLGGAWSRGRCLLLGDAAHAMPPHAGQGVSMALEDAFLAARLLKDLPLAQQQQLDDAFATYDRVRRPRVDEIAKKAASNADVRKKTGPVGLRIKEWVIWAFLWVAWATGRQSVGVEQRHLVYDIDAAKL